MRPTDIDSEWRYVVAIKTVRLSAEQHPFGSLFAEHSWVDVKDAGGWRRVEIARGRDVVGEINAKDVEKDDRWQHRVHVINVYHGEHAKRMIPQIERAAWSYPAAHYQAWPGPNSNTFIDWLSREVDGLSCELYPSAIGKDFAYPVRVGTTTTRTGVELETPVLGVQLGLIEGVELHVLGLTIGVGLFPPKLKIPFMPPIPWGL